MRNIIIVLVFTMFSCSETNTKLLENDPIVKENFSAGDIKELREILDFFDSVVIQNCQTQKKLIICYEEYLSKLKRKVQQTGSVASGLIMDTTELYKFISGIDTNIFNNIWFYINSFNTRTGETYEELNLKSQSIYIDFIKDIASLDTNYNAYYRAVENSGNISPGLVAGILQNYHLINVENERERLILAIDYITINYRKFIEKSTVHNTP